MLNAATILPVSLGGLSWSCQFVVVVVRMTVSRQTGWNRMESEEGKIRAHPFVKIYRLDETHVN